MALVDYSSSDEDDTPVKDQITPNLKRKRDDEPPSDLPPLPSKFYNLYASTTRVSTSDDPSLHGGRKRVTPHVEGNWPTHLYVEWCLTDAEYGPLTKLISTLKENVVSEEQCEIHTFLTSDLGAPLPLHISLSRPIGFAAEQKDAFVDSLDQAIKSSGIRPFDISLSDLDWVANFEKTRWFLVLRLKRPESDGLNKLLHVSNQTVHEFGQPPLYTNSSIPLNRKSKTKSTLRKTSKSSWVDMDDVSGAFHISIGWTLRSPTQRLLEVTKTIALNHTKELNQIRVKVEEIKSKVGNVVTSIPLPRSVSVGNGLFGV